MIRNLFVALFVLSAAVAPATAQDTKLTVFAAASLKNALDEVNKAYTAANGGKEVATSYAGSNALAKQIEEGAPADVFISADLAWMDYLEGKKLIKDGTRSSLLGNRIVLIAPKDSSSAVKLAQGVDLTSAVGDGKLAMANTDSVPAGKYGKAALEKLGAWDGVKDKVAQAENVRAALLLVSRGEAPFGIVYKTDAASDPGVKIVDTFPAETHPPIVYPAAVIAATKNADAEAYLKFLRTPEAAAAFEKQGFAVLD
jgi:molybdate transport system substrate-binding protein